jgi:hypothetical protein
MRRAKREDMSGVYNAWTVRWMVWPDASRTEIRTEPLPLTSTPTPPTRPRDMERRGGERSEITPKRGHVDRAG